MAKKNRVKIPPKIQYKVFYKSGGQCCVCGNRPVQLHHIDENPSNNTEENLAILCPACHNEAHTQHKLSINLTPERIAFCKKEWENTVRENINHSRLPENNCMLDDGNFSYGEALWTYISHEKIPQLIKSFSLSFSEDSFHDLFMSGLIDKKGIPILKNIRGMKNEHVTIYDHFDFGNMQRLHGMYCDAVDSLLLKIEPYEIGSLWHSKIITELISPGSFIFAREKFYFKSGKVINNEETRLVHKKTGDIEVRFMINTRNMFGKSSICQSFTGHKFIAAFLLVKSVGKENDLLVVDCTPIALGVGFKKLSYRIPPVVE